MENTDFGRQLTCKRAMPPLPAPGNLLQEFLQSNHVLESLTKRSMWCQMEKSRAITLYQSLTALFLFPVHTDVRVLVQRGLHRGLEAASEDADLLRVVLYLPRELAVLQRTLFMNNTARVWAEEQRVLSVPPPPPPPSPRIASHPLFFVPPEATHPRR